MSYVYLAAFIAGLLLTVRIMFFGAERRHARALDAMPLRRSEPAIAAFLVMLGVAGYLLSRYATLALPTSVGVAIACGAAWAAAVTGLAIATARVKPEHDPEDGRFTLQGHVTVVAERVPPDGEGAIAIPGGAEGIHLPARSLDGTAIEAGAEVCIERVEDGVALVELWSLVEARL